MITDASESSGDAIKRPEKRGHRFLWWILGCCLLSVVALSVVAYSFLTLDREAATLRKQVVASTNGQWKTRVQFSAGRMTMNFVRAGFSFVDRAEMVDAKLALNSVCRASVGVYERGTKETSSWSRAQLLLDTDKAMNRRGWSRLVGVISHDDTVLIYGSARSDADDPVDICLTVANDRQLVVVSATVNPDKLSELVEKHSGNELKERLKLVQL